MDNFGSDEPDFNVGGITYSARTPRIDRARGGMTSAAVRTESSCKVFSVLLLSRRLYAWPPGMPPRHRRACHRKRPYQKVPAACMGRRGRGRPGPERLPVGSRAHPTRRIVTSASARQSSPHQ